MTKSDDAAELLALTEALSRASETIERDVLESLIADDFACVTPGGAVVGKRQVIDRWAPLSQVGRQDEVAATHEIADAQVLLYGDVGIVLARITDRWTEDGERHEYVEQVFDVWQRRAGRWQFIAAKPTKSDPD